MLFKSAHIIALLIISQATVAEPPSTTSPKNFDLNNANDNQKLSYMLGLDMYEKRSKQGFALDAGMVAQAIRDEQAGTHSSLSTDEHIRIVALKREKIAEFEVRWKALSEKNLAEGKAFLEKKAMEPGVMATDNGILYKILRPGTGKRPTEENIARVHYRGTLLNGDEFDSSYKRGKPVDFPVGKIKTGMKDILLKMREGGKWIFYAPPHVGYGEEGVGRIGPNETLTGEVELIEIVE